MSRVTLPCSRHLSAVEEKHQSGLQICFARVKKNLGHVREDYGNAGDYGRSSLKMWRENQQRNSFRWWRWHSTGSARLQRLKVSTSREDGLNLKPLLTAIAFSSYKKKKRERACRLIYQEERACWSLSDWCCVAGFIYVIGMALLSLGFGLNRNKLVQVSGFTECTQGARWNVIEKGQIV